MQSSRESKICVALRVALLLWTAARILSASTLPGQHEDRHSGVWKLSSVEAAQAPSASSDPATAFDAAAAMAPLNSTLFPNVTSSASPIELGFDTGAA